MWWTPHNGTSWQHGRSEPPALSEVTLVLVDAALPADASHWPVVAAAASSRAPPTARSHYVLCGALASVERLISAGSGIDAPLYVLTNSGTDSVLGVPNLTISSSTLQGAWEEAVALVCSMHIESIAEQIVGHARRAPDAIATSDADTELTYAALCSRAASLGLALAARSVGEGGVVGVTLPTSHLAVICYLGLALRRTAACNIASLATRRGEQLRRLAASPLGGCRALLCDEKLQPPDDDGDGDGDGDGGGDGDGDGAAGETLDSTLRAGGLVVPVLRADLLALHAQAPVPLEAVVAPRGALHDPAFIDWTSGSTGQPKGMATTVWKMSHWVRWRAYHLPLSRYGRRVGTGLFFPWYWHLTLCQGGTLVLIPPEHSVHCAHFDRGARAKSMERPGEAG